MDTNDSILSTFMINNWEKHKIKAHATHKQYNIDAEISETNKIKYFSFDLQKVLLPPIMAGNKDVFFTRRLVIFNEVFASFKKNSNSNYSVVYLDAFSGRDVSNNIDAILYFN